MTVYPPVCVPARARWFATPALVQAGDTLRLSASGTWVDFVIPCSAEGWDAGWLYKMGVVPRIPDEGRYYRLMGRIGDENAPPDSDDALVTFAIGTQNTVEAKRAGRLYVFANDRDGFYWNNWGCLSLHIEVI